MNRQVQLFDDLSLYEGPDVEYKGALGGLPGELWKTYGAFANTEGGTIWLGISQRGECIDVHGLMNAEKLVGDFWNTVNNRSKVNRNVLADDDVDIIPLPDSERKVVLIDIPRANRRERPIYLGSDPFKGTFRRNFEGDYLCTEDEVRRMFADQSDEAADSRILEGYSLEDLDLESLRQFRNRFRSRTADHPWLLLDDRGLLERLGGWRSDRRSGREGLTVAGLLMFGRTHTIVAPDGIPQFHLDYRERLSDDPEIRWSDRLTCDGTWEGNLLQFYQRVVLKLASDPGIKAPFRTDREGFRQTATPVHEALREALVNALVHADYSGQGGIVIDRYTDRFEFSNSGLLLVSREQILRGGVSECRNKSLQRMFQMLGVGDKAGSGISKIRSSWAAQHWQSPSLQETFRPDRVRLVLPMISILSEDLLLILRERYGDLPVGALTPDEVQAVATAASEGSVSNQRLQEMLPLHRVEITKMLKDLVRRGFLAAEGIGRGTRYSLAVSPISRSTPERPSLPAREPSLPASNDARHTDPLHDPLLLELAQPIREATRSTPEQVTDTILRLCEGRFLTVRQLSRLLDRRPGVLRYDYLSKLIRSGDLEPLYATVPSHPKQAYRRRQQV